MTLELGCNSLGVFNLILCNPYTACAFRSFKQEDSWILYAVHLLWH